MKIKVLGCGYSEGVPSIDKGWGVCDKNNPKNSRSRTSLFVQTDNGSNILIDMAPEFRSQYLVNDIGRIDAIIFTHAHFDHTQGFPDARRLYIMNGKPIDIYANGETMDHLEHSYSYMFHRESNIYPAAVTPHRFNSGEEMQVLNDRIRTFHLPHNDNINSMGVRIGDFAYIPDFVEIPQDAMEVLKGVKVLFVSTTFIEGAINHASLSYVLDRVNDLKPERTYMIHMSIEMDYNRMNAYTPDKVFPAYDGLVVTL